VALRGELPRAAVAYYRLTVDSPDYDITISLTTFAGDPDLFVSTTSTHPSPTNYTWSATAYMDDSITIARTGTRRCIFQSHFALHFLLHYSFEQ
jgi:hypothetical protein